MEKREKPVMIDGKVIAKTIKEEIANSIHYDSVNKNKVVNVNRNKQSETFKVENIKVGEAYE